MNTYKHYLESDKISTGYKDINGKEIYKGDILHDREDDNIVEVVFDAKRVDWVVVHKEYKSSLTLKEFLGIDDWVEVIGNIYENPELVNKVKS